MKKIISLVLVITLLSAFFVTASAEDVLLTAPADTATEEVIPQEPAVDYSQYVNFVQGLKIMPEGETFDGTANIKRGQFANYIYNILYANNFDVVDTWYEDLYAPDNFDQIVAPDTGVTYFDDVDKNYEYYQAISKLREIRIMNGTGARTFEPDAEITFEEASIVLVRILGYEFYAKRYPYIPVASMLGIFKGLDYEAERKITHNELARALYNCADIDITVAEYSSEAKTYKQLKGETIYSQFMDIHFAKGIVTGNSVTSLHGTDGYGKNKAEIGGVIYNTQFAPYVGNMIGRNIDFFYRVNPTTEVKEIVYASTTNRDDVITIKASDYDDFDPNTMTMTYYTDEDDTDEVELVGNPKLIYNGKYKALYDETIFDFVNGDITLIAPDGGDYKYIIINDYKSYYVTAVDTVAEKIYAKTYDDVVRNFDIRALKDHQVQYFLADGSQVDITKVTVDSVIDVLEAESNLSFIISNDVLTNFYVGGSYADDTLYVSKGDEVYYPVLPSFYQYAKANDEKALVNGKTYNLYLNSFGQIAYVKPIGVKAGSSIVYVIGAVESSRLGQIGLIEYMNSNAIINTLTVAKDATLIKADGTKIKIKDSTTYKNNFVNYLTSNPYAHVMTVTVSEENLVTKIEIPREFDAERRGEFGLMTELTADGYVNRVWSQGEKMFHNVMIAADTLIFHVNEEETNIDKKYSVIPYNDIGALLQRDTTEIKIVPYNSDPSTFKAECIVVIDPSYRRAGILANNSLQLVEKIVSSKDEDGNPTTEVVALEISKSGTALKKTTFVAEAGKVFEKAGTYFEPEAEIPVKKGDIIQCITSGNKTTAAYIIYSIFDDSGKVINNLKGTKPLYGDERDTIDLNTISNDNKLDSNPYVIADDLVGEKGLPKINYTTIKANMYDRTRAIIFGANAYDLIDGKYLTLTTQPIDRGQPFDIELKDTRYSTATVILPATYIEINVKGNNFTASKGSAKSIKTYKTTGVNCSKIFTSIFSATPNYVVVINEIK